MAESSDWFSRYRFLRPLGQGGMGTVYFAEDRANGNANCVIKQLTNKYTDESEREEAVRLFVREVAILRQLSHPGVVRIFDDHTTADHRYFLVMDYVPGKNLDTVVAEVGPLDSETVVRIAIQCCDVLVYLHGEEIIYRDVKPSNLMLRPDGRVVFIDFGIARNFLPKEVATRVVTAGYSPPEQYFGKPEKRSDIYALGATLSHLLTGQRPKPLAVCSPKQINPEIDVELDELIKKMTAHTVEERPHSAEQVKYDLFRVYKKLHPEWQMPELPAGVTWEQDKNPPPNAPTVNDQPPVKSKPERNKAPAEKPRAGSPPKDKSMSGSGAFKVDAKSLNRIQPHEYSRSRRATQEMDATPAKQQESDTTFFSRVSELWDGVLRKMLGG